MREVVVNNIPTLVIAVVALGAYYVARRLAWAFSWSAWWTFAVTALVAVGAFAGMVIIMKSNYTGVLSGVLSNVSNITLGAMLILVTVLLVMEVVQVFAHFRPLVFGVVAVSLTAVLTIYSLVNAQWMRVYRQDVELPNLEQPLRIAHVTDIHLGHYWGEGALARMAYLIEREGVDAVVITGDMFDGRANLNPKALEPLRRITAPIYFVEGNHDGYTGVYEIKALLVDRDIHVLSNEVLNFKGLQIVGLDYLIPDEQSRDTFHGSKNRRTMQGVLGRLPIDKSKAIILLHHNPVGANYAAQSGVNLYLAGHTHGGQIFPVTLIAELMFEYNRGLYRYDDNMQIYVSQGVGTFGPPMRLGTHSEITILNLTPQK